MECFFTMYLDNLDTYYSFNTFRFQKDLQHRQFVRIVTSVVQGLICIVIEIFRLHTLLKFGKTIITNQHGVRFLRSGDMYLRKNKNTPGVKQTIRVVKRQPVVLFGWRHQQLLIFVRSGFVQPVVVQKISVVEVHHIIACLISCSNNNLANLAMNQREQEESRNSHLLAQQEVTLRTKRILVTIFYLADSGVYNEILIFVQQIKI